MSLQGVLTDFGVADIFQLISQQRKTGILSVERHERTLEIHFVEGGVLRALPAESRPDGELGALMIRIGLLSDSDLSAAVRSYDEEAGGFTAEGDYVLDVSAAAVSS